MNPSNRISRTLQFEAGQEALQRTSSKRSFVNIFSLIAPTETGSPCEEQTLTISPFSFDESFSLGGLDIKTPPSSTSSSGDELSPCEEGSSSEGGCSPFDCDEIDVSFGLQEKQPKRHCSPQTSLKTARIGPEKLGFLNDNNHESGQSCARKILTPLSPERQPLISLPVSPSSSILPIPSPIRRLPRPEISIPRTVKNSSRKSPPPAPMKARQQNRRFIPVPVYSDLVAHSVGTDIAAPIGPDIAAHIGPDSHDFLTLKRMEYDSIIGQLHNGEFNYEGQTFAIQGVPLGRGFYREAFDISPSEKKRLVPSQDNQNIIVKAFHSRCIEVNANKYQIQELDKFTRYSLEQYHIMRRYLPVAEIFNISGESLVGNVCIQSKVKYSVNVRQWDFEIKQDPYSGLTIYCIDHLLHKEASDFPELVSVKRFFDVAAELILVEGPRTLDPDLQPDNLRFNDQVTRELICIDSREVQSDGCFDRVANLVKDARTWSRDRLKVWDYLTSSWGNKDAFRSVVEDQRNEIILVEKDNLAIAQRS